VSDDRGLVDKFVDAGATADWITPTAEALRNVVTDGACFTVLSTDWYDLKWELQRRRIPFWGEAIHWIDGEYWATFSVQSENAALVRDLSGYRSSGGRGRALFMLLVLAGLLAGAVLLVVGVLGGAL